MSWKISQLNILGVKGVLEKSGDFSLKDGKSIAIFAPNGCGKSGYADAIEYLFSYNGSVEHLGEGGEDSEHGGKHALHHVLAEKAEIDPQISIVIKNSELKQEISLTRSVKTGRTDIRPIQLSKALDKSPAHRILRQHDLRRFVVDMKPREKYTEISRWLGLDQLEVVLTHLTKTQNDLAEANPDREISERLLDISESTCGAVINYDKAAVFKWCSNEIQKCVNEKVTIKTLTDLDTIIQKLDDRHDQLISKRTASQKIIESKRKLEELQYRLINDTEGLLSICSQSLNLLKTSQDEIIKIREITKEAIFQEVWESSKKLLDAEKIDECPICLTPWSETKAGSQKNACISLASCLSNLTEYRNAQYVFETYRNQFVVNKTELLEILRRMLSITNILCLDKLEREVSLIIDEFNSLSAEEDILSKNDEYVLIFRKCFTLSSSRMSEEKNKIEIEEIPDDLPQQNLTDNLKKLKSALIRLDQLEREAKAYRQIANDFDVIAKTIQRQTGELVNSIINSLKTDIVQIYKKIQDTDAVPDIIIEPNTEDKTLNLRVYFHSDDRVVPPAGYLSESQINTLGVAIFISAIKIFNTDFPFIVLDDIVSSYDADHRARIVDVIAEDLEDFQIFLTTHDERFYAELKLRLQDRNWQFDRIYGWALDTGPKRQSDVTKPDYIQKLIDSGNAQIAGNALRQYVEEWLDRKCVEYWAHILHKRPLKEYERTLFDFWDPFILSLKGIKGEFFKKQIENKVCYQRFKGHALLNYYSHSQANPYDWGSIGDVKYVFKEFQEFQKLFNCYSCSKSLKYDHDSKSIFCSCGGKIFP